MGRLFVYIPEIDDSTALFFFSSGDSWKLRDFSSGRDNVIMGSLDGQYSADQILSKVTYQESAPRKPVDDFHFWKAEIDRVNNILIQKGILKSVATSRFSTDLPFKADLDSLKDQIRQNSKADNIKLDSLNLLDEIAKIDKLGEIDCAAAVGKARKIIEIIISELSTKIGGNKETLFNTISHLHQNKIIPSKIFTLLTAIRKYGNIGLHYNPSEDNKLTLQDVKLIGMMTANIVEWYVTVDNE